MNKYAADNTFTPQQVRVLKLMHELAMGLSRFRFLEFAFSILAIVYGAGLFVFDGRALSPVPYKPFVPLITNHPSVYGALIAVFGLLGLYGVVCKSQRIRLVSAAALSLLWAGLSWHYLLAQPPFLLDFIFYAFDSAMEACIFVRVYADLDYYWHRQ